MIGWLKTHPRGRNLLIVLAVYALSTAVTIFVGYGVLGMHPSYNDRCWGWTSE